jgi:hypothetical protein
VCCVVGEQVCAQQRNTGGNCGCQGQL